MAKKTKEIDQEGRLYGTIPTKLLLNSVDFIRMTRKGIPGTWLKLIVHETGLRGIFVSLLNVWSGNLSRLYRAKTLNKFQSENVLDALRLILQADKTWESKDLAIQWLNSPIPALGDEKPLAFFDTFEGRRLVSQVLTKIQRGEFS